MKFRVAIIVVLSLLWVACSQDSQTDKLQSYTDQINQSALKKEVVSIYPSGTEKAVVFFLKEQANRQTVKEVHFYENGFTQVEGTLKDGQKHGKWTFYHPNGKVWSKGYFEGGKSVGCFEVFEPDGSIKVKSYYKDGKKIKEELFKEGKLQETVDLQS